MVSGIETAGLVLASFPVVISAIDVYRKGLKPLMTWIRYRKQVIEMSSALGCQYVVFQNNIQRLLDPIVGTDNAMMKRLLECSGINYSDWESPALIEKLKERLSGSYSSYMETVSRINEILKELETALGIVLEEVKGGEIKVARNASGWLTHSFPRGSGRESNLHFQRRTGRRSS